MRALRKKPAITIPFVPVKFKPSLVCGYIWKKDINNVNLIARSPHYPSTSVRAEFEGGRNSKMAGKIMDFMHFKACIYFTSRRLCSLFLQTSEKQVRF